MNCAKFQNQISAYLDGDLDASGRKSVEGHLEQCSDCSAVHEDLMYILDFCGDSLAEEPPNSQALWCRINNIIETEVAPEIESEKATATGSQGWISGLRDWSLQLSATQVISAVAGIALISSLLTVIGIRNLSDPSDLVKADRQETVFEKMMASLGLGETAAERQERKIKEQKAAIEYWNKRVEVRRAEWSADTRDVFDRNLREIEKAVAEYTRLLEENPQDTISNEMLDSVLKEKMELLREFSEL